MSENTAGDAEDEQGTQRPPFNPRTRELAPAWHREYSVTWVAIKMTGDGFEPVMFRFWDEKVVV
jgi:hypothetical protein